MSDIRIALVAEGPTDCVLIEASLRAVLSPRSFVLTQLQPEATSPFFGGGWGGVLKWCAATAKRWQGLLEDDPLLANFDFLIIHLDTDVSHQSYANCGTDVVAMAATNKWPSLPCSQQCPPVRPTCLALQAVLKGWLRHVDLGRKTVVCLPAQSTGAWLAAAVLSAHDPLLNGAECNPKLENALSRLLKKQRIKKNLREYRANANAICQNWNQVKTLCSQADQFEKEVHAAWP